MCTIFVDSPQVHVRVSKRTIEFSNAAACLPEEQMSDRLELGFSKPSHGGGEVESMEYDVKTGAGRVTFLNTGGVYVLPFYHDVLQLFMNKSEMKPGAFFLSPW